jgi:hypothetical protein
LHPTRVTPQISQNHSPNPEKSACKPPLFTMKQLNISFVLMTLISFSTGEARRRGYNPNPQPWSPTLIRSVLDTPYSPEPHVPQHNDKEIGDLVARTKSPPRPPPKVPKPDTDDTRSNPSESDLPGSEEEVDMRPFLPHMYTDDFPKIVDIGRAAKSSVRVLTRRAKNRVITVSNAVVSGGETLVSRRGRRGR